MLSAGQITILREVLRLGLSRQLPLYLVGGIVRDLFRKMDRPEKDIDLVVEGNAIDFAGICAGTIGGQLKTFPKFFTAKLEGLPASADLNELDFASCREEIYERPGALPRVALASINEDLKRRDFSVNSIALELSMVLDWAAGSAVPEELALGRLDPFDGYGDLNARRIRILHDRSFIDDPTRIYRALRYAARIRGALEPHTAALLEAALRAGALETISEYRKFVEIRKILAEDAACSILRSMQELAISEAYLPYPRQEHARLMAMLADLDSLRIVKRQIVPSVRLGLLFFVCGKQANALLKRLNYSKQAAAAILADIAAIEAGGPEPQASDVALLLGAVCAEGSARSLFSDAASEKGLITHN